MSVAIQDAGREERGTEAGHLFEGMNERTNQKDHELIGFSFRYVQETYRLRTDPLLVSVLYS